MMGDDEDDDADDGDRVGELSTQPTNVVATAEDAVVLVVTTTTLGLGFRV